MSDDGLLPTIAGTMPFELTFHFFPARLGLPVSRAVWAVLYILNRLSWFVSCQSDPQNPGMFTPPRNLRNARTISVQFTGMAPPKLWNARTMSIQFTWYGSPKVMECENDVRSIHLVWLPQSYSRKSSVIPHHVSVLTEWCKSKAVQMFRIAYLGFIPCAESMGRKQTEVSIPAISAQTDRSVDPCYIGTNRQKCRSLLKWLMLVRHLFQPAASSDKRRSRPP